MTDKSPTDKSPTDKFPTVEPILTHLNQNGEAHMVDVAAKPATLRIARAGARIRMQPATLQRICGGTLPKGDVLATARIAGIMAAKRTPELIPLCHPLPIDGVELTLVPQEPDLILIEATVRTIWRTGVEMEAMTAAAVAALTLYDMAKAIDRSMVIEQIQLLEKSGGRSGHYERT
jgi:cyclic pyranopterin phosphate synthase